MNTGAVKRIQLDLTPKAIEGLQALKAKTEAASYTEVVRRALALHLMLLESEGSRFTIQRKDGSTVEYILV